MTENTADPIPVALAYAVKDFIDANMMKSDLSFNPLNLTDAMMQQSSMFSHYGVLAAQASHQVDVIKLLLENTEAAVYKVIRDDMISTGDKYTETLLEKMVSRNSRVIGMKKALNEAKRVESIGKIAVEGFRHRRDMLVQHAFIAREEMKGELRVADKSAREDALDAQKALFLKRNLTATE